MIVLKNLTKEDLIKKVTLLLEAIKSNEENKELTFGLKADWNEDGMKIIIGIE